MGEKKKKLTFLIPFYISYESGIKNFSKWSINRTLLLFCILFLSGSWYSDLMIFANDMLFIFLE